MILLIKCVIANENFKKCHKKGHEALGFLEKKHGWMP